MSELARTFFKDSQSEFFERATDATFRFTPSLKPDPALGSFGTFKLTTVQGTASAVLFTPGDDIASAEIKTIKETSFNWSTIDLSKKLTLTGEIVLSGKLNTITVTFYQPSDGALVAAVMGTITPEPKSTGFTRVASFKWTPNDHHD